MTMKIHELSRKNQQFIVIFYGIETINRDKAIPFAVIFIMFQNIYEEV